MWQPGVIWSFGPATRTLPVLDVIFGQGLPAFWAYEDSFATATKLFQRPGVAPEKEAYHHRGKGYEHVSHVGINTYLPERIKDCAHTDGSQTRQPGQPAVNFHALLHRGLGCTPLRQTSAQLPELV